MFNFKIPRIRLRTGTFGFGIATAALFAIALFLGIAGIGFHRIWDEVLSVGWGLPAIILVHVGQLAFCALAWATLLSDIKPARATALKRLFTLRWVRESIDSLLPVAQVGGEIAAARLLTHQGLALPVAGASMPSRTRSPDNFTTVTTIDSPSRIRSLSRLDSTNMNFPCRWKNVLMYSR